MRPSPPQTVACAGALLIALLPGDAVAQPVGPSPISDAPLTGVMHTGVPIDGVEGLSPPQYQSSTRGWTASFPKGLARVYVAPDLEAAHAWFLTTEEMIAKQKPQPLADFGDEARAGGDEVVLVRDGNICVLVQIGPGARAWTERILATIDDSARPWPDAPRLEPTPQGWRPTTPIDATHVSWQGGQRVTNAGLVFSTPPEAVVVWDDLGRATRQHFDDQGRPVDPPDPPDVPPGGSAR